MRWPETEASRAAPWATALRVPLRHRVRRPALQTRFAQTAGPEIPGERAVAAAVANCATRPTSVSCGGALILGSTGLIC